MLISIMVFLTIVFVVLFAALNHRQLYALWSIHREHKRLVEQKIDPVHENPAPMEDRFETDLSSMFWKHIILNGGGKVSNETAWHATAITAKRGLTIYHFPDATFENESSSLFAKPAAGQYNNTSLIGGTGFQPTPNVDVVLEFTLQTSHSFYGTAGVVFQPEGTIQKDGIFTKPFDMFGVSVIGKESSVLGVNGPLCYLALDWNPVEVKPLHVDSHTWHNYKIRLRMVDRSKWLGVVHVDGAKLCSLSMPPLGPLEVHIWSDNYFVTSTPNHWWEIGPRMDLQFQDGGNKQFHIGKIKIFTETR